MYIYKTAVFFSQTDVSRKHTRRHCIIEKKLDIKADNKRLHNLTLASIGVMAYVFADIIHEVIGHGLTSLILGNKITLLTSVYFRSEPHSFVTDIFGPIFNLVAGLTIRAVLKQVDISNLYIKLLLILTMAFNFFWFSWMCIYSGITNKGDFAFYVSGQTELYIWRLFLIISGLFTYYLTFKLTLKRTGFQSLSAKINIRQLFRIPYLAAGISALIAVSFYRPFSFDNYIEAFIYPMFFPILFLSRQLKNSKRIDKAYSFGLQEKLILLGLTLAIFFSLTMGKGLKW